MLLKNSTSCKAFTALVDGTPMSQFVEKPRKLSLKIDEKSDLDWF